MLVLPFLFLVGFGGNSRQLGILLCLVLTAKNLENYHSCFRKKMKGSEDSPELPSSEPSSFLSPTVNTHPTVYYTLIILNVDWVQWYTPLIPALGS